ncbi:hypothetical protein BU24DRAFT_435091 [Aaosphaeria arxii CBS 175.79]|uniref:Cap binding protein n=1 Tax=Aaosphaeria arxii CBS 175.79 TaxID=1450172 RepID=A0A6A5XIM4_9PLEO|nr:uncharacterized protein BU24DRAFT_435091 [Aaosphaeria arxii CBS 175.79]KAF2012681.1 hypothetical protein BU24DRAFT_435091 [Aaosphaeria arxii CBS 175.79]
MDIRHDDNDRRRRNNNGYRGGGNRKRARDDEDDYHYDPRRRPPQRQRGGDDQPASRRRYEEVPFAKLRRMTLNIAGSAQLPQDEAIELAKVFAENYDDERLRNDYFDIIIQLILEQPVKIPFVAAVIFYGNDAKSEIMADALKRVSSRAQEALNGGLWKEFKLMLRFLACLQARYDGDGVFTLLNQLFDTVVDLQSANENDVVGIELVKIILLTIPYALAYSGSAFESQAKDVLDNTGIVASNMLPMEGLIHSYLPDSEEKPLAYHSVIGLLQQQLTTEAETGWPLVVLPKFDREGLRKQAGEDTMTDAPASHPFPTIEIPSPMNPGSRPLFPESYLSLYGNQDLVTVPDITNIASSLFRDAIVDTIDQLHFNRDAAAKLLIEIDNYWTVGVFAKRSTSFELMREINEEKAHFKPEDVIMDAIFSQIFKLPAPEHKLVFYHSIITSACKIAPTAIAPSLGRAIRAVYKYIDIMDLELVNRFLDWFTHHLSNFEFRWRWTEWLEDLPLSDLHPKKAYILAAIDKEIRLSFAKRIRSTVPEQMHYLIPNRLDEDNSPDFKYDDPSTPYSQEGQALITQLRKKASDEVIQEIINKIHTLAVEQGIADVLVPSTDALVTSICRMGAKSLSHVLSCIERNKDRLLSVANESDAARRQIVASVVEYWKDQPGVAVRIIDILLNYQILAPITVVQWALGDFLGAGEVLAKSWVFEMVSNTMSKVANRNRQIIVARFQKGLPQEQIEMVEATLTKDRESARELFKYIDDQLSGVATGAADTLIERESSGELSAEDGQYVRAWAVRWRTVFQRKAQVEESVVGEQAVDAKIKYLAAQPEPVPIEEDANAAGNGVDVKNSDEIELDI